MSPIPVLLYHSVSDSPAPEIVDFSVSVAEFARQLDAVVASGREAVDFRELVRRMSTGELAPLENCVCVTFDDGWQDNLAAAEALRARSIPATVFVTSGLIGGTGYLSRAELQELAGSPGIEIGAHSKTHPRLDELRGDRLRDEVAGSGQALSEMIGETVTTFAYPHGNHDRTVVEAAKAAGYVGAAAVKNALSHPTDDPFAVARWTITAKSDASEVERLLVGEGAPLAWRGERLRTRAYRGLRRLRSRFT